MADIIQIRRDLAANWTAADPVLAQGELGVETDTLKAKIGDGMTAWTGLDYLIEAPASYLLDRANHTGTQALATISDSGTAASEDVTTSATDTTAGRLLKVGDFGVGDGVRLNGQDLDALNTSGLYYVNDTSTNKPTATGGTVIVSRDKTSLSTITSQVFISRDELVFFRHRDDDNIWQPWRELYHTGNLLGTVSQSAGVPTGAVIETGTNTVSYNGTASPRRWVVWADGTVIITGEIHVDVTISTIQQANLGYDLADAPSAAFYSVKTSASSAEIQYGNMRFIFINTELNRFAFRLITAGTANADADTDTINFTVIGRKW